MGRRRMKTNGDEKETHLAETTATYALGVFCQLVNPYISVFRQVGVSCLVMYFFRV